MLHTYTNTTKCVDTSLLDDDKLSFAVLVNILSGTFPLQKVITDHKRIIIALSAPVYPAWIWTPDDVTEEELDTIYQTLKKEFAPLENYRFNAKYNIAAYLIDRINEEFELGYHITVNMVTYDCPNPKPPVKEVDGKRECLSLDDLELAARLVREASIAIGDVVIPEEKSVELAKEQLERQVLYIWRDASGKPVAFCDRNTEKHYTKVSQCYTVPEARGKGYAGRLIYELCKESVEAGQLPMLYADGDYAPSNRCYQNIGFELKEKIATIGV